MAAPGFVTSEVGRVAMGGEPGRGSQGVPDRGFKKYSCYPLACKTGVGWMGGGVCGEWGTRGGPLSPARLALEALRGSESQSF